MVYSQSTIGQDAMQVFNYVPIAKKEFREIEGKLKNKKIKTENGKKEKGKEQAQDKKGKRGLNLSNDIVDHSIHSTRSNPQVCRGRAFCINKIWVIRKLLI